MTLHSTLQMEIATYWHAGTGRGVSLQLDALVRRDRRGLPILPGRTVKGLLRDAVSLAGEFGWVGPREAERLFGTPTTPGEVLVSPARLPQDASDLIVASGHLRAGLFETLFSTAIDFDSGTARRKSLRSMEVVVPLCLHAALTGPAVSSGWLDSLRTSLPLLRAVGSHRNRGLGRIGRLELTEPGGRS
jgi:RAMP superfamily